MKIEQLSDENIETHRFFCNCGAINHIFDIAIEDDFLTEIQHYDSCGCNRSLWSRLKMAFALVFNLPSTLSLHEFILNQDDREELSLILSNKRNDAR